MMRSAGFPTCMPRRNPTLPTLPHTSRSLTKEAASYWRGLQLQLPAGTPLFGDYPTLDLAASPITARRSAGGAASRTGGAAGGGGGFGSGGGDAEREAAERRLRVEEALQALQDSCKEAGVKLGALRGGELQAVVPQLRDPQGHTLTGLIQVCVGQVWEGKLGRSYSVARECLGGSQRAVGYQPAGRPARSQGAHRLAGLGRNRSFSQPLPQREVVVRIANLSCCAGLIND